MAKRVDGQDVFELYEAPGHLIRRAQLFDAQAAELIAHGRHEMFWIRHGAILSLIRGFSRPQRRPAPLVRSQPLASRQRGYASAT